MRLFEDHTFRISTSQGAGVDIKGTWQNASRDRASLRVETVQRDRARGSGTVELGRRDSFDRVSITADGPGIMLRLSFDTAGDSVRRDRDRDGGDILVPKAKTFPMSKAHSGRGTYTYDGRRYRVDRVEVSTDRDGSYEISWTGDRSGRISGRYKRNGQFLSLDIAKGSEGLRFSGAGKLDLTKFSDDWWQLGFAGRDGDRRFFFEFKN